MGFFISGIYRIGAGFCWPLMLILPWPVTPVPASET
jgi:hypothetical protein